jgi:enoyl-CoA hydratase
MIRVEHEGPVAVVTIDRALSRNAIDRQHAQDLADAFRAFEADSSVRVAVLDGVGGNFCAGADLRKFSEGQGNRLEPDGDGPMGPSRMLLSKPVIASIAGYAVAGGLELALWCDLRIAEEGSTFGVFCRRFGVPLIDGGTVRLPRLIGLSRAMDLILTGRAVGADEALQMGLVNRVVPRGTARREAIALAYKLALMPQAAMLADRESAYAQFGMPLDAAIAHEWQGGIRTLTEARDGAQRFVAGEGRHGSTS